MMLIASIAEGSSSISKRFIDDFGLGNQTVFLWRFKLDGDLKNEATFVGSIMGCDQVGRIKIVKR